MAAGNDELVRRPDAPLARKVTETIHSGDAAALEQLLREQPALARARLGDGQSRTLLHVVTDWPGKVPDAAPKIRVLVAAGADVNARFTGPHTETPLHWAASSDDVEALDALLDAGADIEADGAVIGGGTPMADAVAFGQWSAARRLLNAARAPTFGRPRHSDLPTVSATSSPEPRRHARPSTTRCGAPHMAVSARPRSCSLNGAPIRHGSVTTSSPRQRPPTQQGPRARRVAAPASREPPARAVTARRAWSLGRLQGRCALRTIGARGVDARLSADVAWRPRWPGWRPTASGSPTSWCGGDARAARGGSRVAGALALGVAVSAT